MRTICRRCFEHIISRAVRQTLDRHIASGRNTDRDFVARNGCGLLCCICSDCVLIGTCQRNTGRGVQRYFIADVTVVIRTGCQCLFKLEVAGPGVCHGIGDSAGRAVDNVCVDFYRITLDNMRFLFACLYPSARHGVSCCVKLGNSISRSVGNVAECCIHALLHGYDNNNTGRSTTGNSHCFTVSSIHIQCFKICLRNEVAQVYITRQTKRYLIVEYFG